MKFTKMQGAGNDFVVVDTGARQYDWTKLAVAMCDRHYGIGADGLLLLLPSKVADFKMSMFNPDGSESNTCGNGLRCLVKYFIEGRGATSGAREILVETGAGIRKAKVYQVGGEIAQIQTSMGVPKFGEKDIPVLIEPQEGEVVDIKSMVVYSMIVEGRRLPLSLVSMGNPHAVHFCQGQVADFPLAQIGPKIERHRAFPKGTNFEVARVVNRQRLESRVWEKGAGETLACGSGACAITVAARLHGYVADKVEVKLPGGPLEVEWDEAGEVFLSGPAETVFGGEWPGGSLDEEGSYQFSDKVWSK